jgi:hypothetical protein
VVTFNDFKNKDNIPTISTQEVVQIVQVGNFTASSCTYFILQNWAIYFELFSPSSGP